MSIKGIFQVNLIAPHFPYSHPRVAISPPSNKAGLLFVVNHAMLFYILTSMEQGKLSQSKRIVALICIILDSYKFTRSLRALITTSTPEESAGSTPCLLALTCCPKNKKVLLIVKQIETNQTRYCQSVTRYEILQPFYKQYLALVVFQLHCLQEVLYPLTEIFLSAFCS